MLEIVRELYYPSNGVRTLLIGESPPHGGTFFYRGDSYLFRYTKEGFEKALNRAFSDHAAFLDYFMRKGFYLDDLCLSPVNQLPSRERKDRRHEAESSLSERLGRHNPERIIVVMKGIEGNVKSALQNTGLRLKGFYVLPFPAMSHQRAYVEGLADILRAQLPGGEV